MTQQEIELIQRFRKPIMDALSDYIINPSNQNIFDLMEDIKKEKESLMKEETPTRKINWNFSDLQSV